MNHCLEKVNPATESHIFNGDACINSNDVGIKKEPNDLEDMEMETEKHEVSCLWLEIGKTKGMKSVISSTDNSEEVASCGGNSCKEQIMVIKSDEFCDQAIRDDKQREYNDYDTQEVGTCDCCIKKESIYDIKMSTEVGKCENFDLVTVKSDVLSNKPVFDNDHEKHKITEVEKYENDVKEENIEVVLTDIKSFSKDSTTEFINKGDHESSGVYWLKCDFCEYKAKYKNVLWMHIRRKHNTTVSWHNCQLCNYKTKISAYLNHHLKYKHEMSVKWYQCQFCQLKFKAKSSLTKHLEHMHDLNIKWHHCQHCKFKTKYNYSLEDHLAYVHKIIIDEKYRLQQCQFCDYNSLYMFKLKQHLKSEHDQKKFQED